VLFLEERRKEEGNVITVENTNLQFRVSWFTTVQYSWDEVIYQLLS